jgi:hypothetical protein
MDPRKFSQQPAPVVQERHRRVLQEISPALNRAMQPHTPQSFSNLRPMQQQYSAGGLATDGGGIDPVSGNPVPVGSNPVEVRDDIEASVSEGEYVVPADVVRYYGVKFFEDLRQEAKSEYAQMDSEGRVGGEAPMVADVPDPEDPYELAAMINSGEEEPVEMFLGGLIGGLFGGGGSSSSASGPANKSVSMPDPDEGKTTASQFADVTTGPKFVPEDYAVVGSSLFNRTGRNQNITYMSFTNGTDTIQIPFLNGEPLIPIPDGYWLVGSNPQQAQQAQQQSQSSRGDGAGVPMWSRSRTSTRGSGGSLSDLFDGSLFDRLFGGGASGGAGAGYAPGGGAAGTWTPPPPKTLREVAGYEHVYGPHDIAPMRTTIPETKPVVGVDVYGNPVFEGQTYGVPEAQWRGRGAIGEPATGGLFPGLQQGIGDAARAAWGSQLAFVRLRSGADGHSGNHAGAAADVYIHLKDGTIVSAEDKNQAEAIGVFFEQLGARGFNQFGFGNKYMGDKHLVREAGAANPLYDTWSDVPYNYTKSGDTGFHVGVPNAVVAAWKKGQQYDQIWKSAPFRVWDDSDSDFGSSNIGVASDTNGWKRRAYAGFKAFVNQGAENNIVIKPQGGGEPVPFFALTPSQDAALSMRTQGRFDNLKKEVRDLQSQTDSLVSRWNQLQKYKEDAGMLEPGNRGSLPAADLANIEDEQQSLDRQLKENAQAIVDANSEITSLRRSALSPPPPGALELNRQLLENEKRYIDAGLAQGDLPERQQLEARKSEIDEQIGWIDSGALPRRVGVNTQITPWTPPQEVFSSSAQTAGLTGLPAPAKFGAYNRDFGTPDPALLDLAIKSAEAEGVPPKLLAAVIGAESGWNSNKVSNAGAIGIAQFMPDTAASYGIDPRDPLQAIPAAAKYLANSFRQHGSWDLALAGYNAGDGNVQKYGGMPPFTETQNYVNGVMSWYNDPSWDVATAAPAQSGGDWTGVDQATALGTPGVYDGTQYTGPQNSLFENNVRQEGYQTVWATPDGTTLNQIYGPNTGIQIQANNPFIGIGSTGPMLMPNVTPMTIMNAASAQMNPQELINLQRNVGRVGGVTGVEGMGQGADGFYEAISTSEFSTHAAGRGYNGNYSTRIRLTSPVPVENADGVPLTVPFNDKHVFKDYLRFNDGWHVDYVTPELVAAIITTTGFTPLSAKEYQQLAESDLASFSIMKTMNPDQYGSHEEMRAAYENAKAAGMQADPEKENYSRLVDVVENGYKNANQAVNVGHIGISWKEFVTGTEIQPKAQIVSSGVKEALSGVTNQLSEPDTGVEVGLKVEPGESLYQRVADVANDATRLGATDTTGFSSRDELTRGLMSRNIDKQLEDDYGRVTNFDRSSSSGNNNSSNATSGLGVDRSGSSSRDSHSGPTSYTTPGGRTSTGATGSTRGAYIDRPSGSVSVTASPYSTGSVGSSGGYSSGVSRADTSNSGASYAPSSSSSSNSYTGGYTTKVADEDSGGRGGRGGYAQFYQGGFVQRRKKK